MILLGKKKITIERESYQHDNNFNENETFASYNMIEDLNVETEAEYLVDDPDLELSTSNLDDHNEEPSRDIANEMESDGLLYLLG